mmetsp:Transcript_23772/g.55386  ORF Transcript_23772/g.55386 Transcript_23772/m.55386 type:complete len:123 (+) Transcript_23772:32-400(+)
MGNAHAASARQGPQSVHGPDYTQLVWMSGFYSQFKRPQGLSQVCSPQELEQIIDFGDDYASFFLIENSMTMACCAGNPFEPDGGDPAAEMRAAFPHLRFKFDAEYLYSQSSHWQHIITVTRA